MSGIVTILLMSAMLGATSFGIGMLPLFFTFSSMDCFSLDKRTAILTKCVEARIAYISTLGTGLLLGAALGIIIPECVYILGKMTMRSP